MRAKLSIHPMEQSAPDEDMLSAVSKFLDNTFKDDDTIAFLRDIKAAESISPDELTIVQKRAAQLLGEYGYSEEDNLVAGNEGIGDFFSGVGAKLSAMVDSLVGPIKALLNFSEYADKQISSLETLLGSKSVKQKESKVSVSAEDFRRLSSRKATKIEVGEVTRYSKLSDRILSSDLIYKETLSFIRALGKFAMELEKAKGNDEVMAAYADTMGSQYKSTVESYKKQFQLKRIASEDKSSTTWVSDLLLGYLQFSLKVYGNADGSIVGKETIEFSQTMAKVNKDGYVDVTEMQALSLTQIKALLSEAKFMAKTLAKIKSQNQFQAQINRAYEQGTVEYEKTLKDAGVGAFARGILTASVRSSEKSVMAAAQLPMKIAQHHTDVIKTILSIASKAIDNLEDRE